MNYDICIIGGGLAGSTLAHRLKQLSPNLSICILEKKSKFHKKVGESTSDLTAIYLRRLGIDHLLKKHIQKTGLRFLFKDGSEFSSPAYKSIANGFHLDRSIFDEDMLVECEKLGVVVKRDAQFKSYSKPTVFYNDESLECKWVVDASGKAGVLVNQLGWRDNEQTLPTASTWAHFENLNPHWDELKSSTWDTHAIGPQAESTIHFMGEFYWWWCIPLRDGTTSLGLVYDTNYHQGNPHDIFDYLKDDHPALKKMLEGSNLIKKYHYPSLAYSSRKVYEDGVISLGDSVGFCDPLFSPGMELVLQQVENVAELIAMNASEKKWHRYEKKILKAMETRIFLYRERYGSFESFKQFRVWVRMDFLGYYVFHVFPSVLIESFIKRPVILNGLQKFIYSVLRGLYLNEKRTTPQVSYSELKVPSQWMIPFKSIQLGWLWLRDFLRFPF
jgi:flavin-dependent dehydrogenase